MGAYTLLQDLTVATNSTSVVLNDFGTITKDDFVKVVVTHVESANASYDFTIHANAQSTQTNYHSQRLAALGTSVFASRQNTSSLGDTGAGRTATRIGYIKLSENDRFNIFINQNFGNGADVRNEFRYVTSSGATFPSGITSLTFNANTNGIGTGSRIQIYKLAAEKVADFVTTSNSTQVDIPFPTGTFDPEIDKDSEYLLVSDIENNDSSAGMVINLVPNDLTTLTGYHAQRIIGDGSSATSERRNDALMASVLPLERVLSHTHIKLSNINAYTSQSYSIRQYGTSSVMVQNSFVSSTAENITSITKLNIVAEGVTTGIKAGSRFILYKLYE